MKKLKQDVEQIGTFVAGLTQEEKKIVLTILKLAHQEMREASADCAPFPLACVSRAIAKYPRRVAS